MIFVMKIVNTHALRGEVKALYYADSPDFFEEVTRLYTENGGVMDIEAVREHKGALLVKFKGIDEVNAAQALRGLKLYVKESDLPPLPEGRYYIADLLGCTAYLEDKTPLGVVSDVLQSGGCDILSIRTADNKDILIPNHKDFVKETDVINKSIIITPIEGMIE